MSLEGGREGDQPGHGASRGPAPGGRPQHRFGARGPGGSSPRVGASSQAGQVGPPDRKDKPETAKHDVFDPGSIPAPLQAGRLALQARSGAASK